MSYFYLTNAINMPLGSSYMQGLDAVCKLTRLGRQEVVSCTLRKLSVDARRKNDVHFVCSYVVETNSPTCPKGCTPYVAPVDVLQNTPKICRKKVIVVGAGPAGLFAARYLAESGCEVTLVERGGDIDKRVAVVNGFFGGGAFDVNTNVQYGLGGAGTFSDGKLTSGISSPLTATVFNEFVRMGAPKDILYSATPHIGTDNLRKVVANMRDKIAQNGTVLFDCLVTDFIVEHGVVKGVVAGGRQIYADAVVLAVGHSARDTFEKLHLLGADMTFKPFAVGVRAEHDRRFINTAQYGLFATHRDLPTANYKMAVTANGRNCYTFCMCPGGVVVAANSEENSVVVNGMSNHDRMAANSNSALVVNVTQQDVEAFGNDCLCGMRFQHELEQRCFSEGYVAPAQNIADFVADKLTTTFDVAPSYPRGVRSCRLDDVLPQFVAETLREALPQFGRRIVGYDKCGVLTAVESRTSSPVRIVRNALLQSNLAHLYPTGEGAGYAGGIVSAAVDGLRVAMGIVNAEN